MRNEQCPFTLGAGLVEDGPYTCDWVYARLRTAVTPEAITEASGRPLLPQALDTWPRQGSAIRFGRHNNPSQSSIAVEGSGRGE